jgi:hypothetical protein
METPLKPFFFLINMLLYCIVFSYLHIIKILSLNLCDPILDKARHFKFRIPVLCWYWLATCFHAGILIRLFDPEDGDMSEIDFQWTTMCYALEESTHHNHCSEISDLIQ